MKPGERREWKTRLMEIQVLTMTGILVMLTQTPSSTAKLLFVFSITSLVLGSLVVLYAVWLENRETDPQKWFILNKFIWYHYNEVVLCLYALAILLIPFAALTTIYGAQLKSLLGLN